MPRLHSQPIFLLVYVNLLMGRRSRRQMPLGLQQVAAAARQAGWAVAGRYWGGELTKSGFQADIATTQPALVGFYTDMLNVSSLSRLLRRWTDQNRPLTILGGPEATFNYRRVMADCPADLLVRGDGEPVLAELLFGDLYDPDFLGQIRGLSFRYRGVVQHNPDRPPGRLADYPLPDRHLSPQEGWTLHLLTARGCPHRCAFCSEAGRPYRPRPLDQVKAEVQAAFQAGKPRWLVILDDTFTADARRAADLGRFLGKVYGGPWSCEVSALDLSRHPDLARQLVAAGLSRVQIGIESGNTETLQVYRKPLTREIIEQAIDNLMAAGVQAVYGNFIVGAPGETAALVERNMAWAAALIRRYPGRLELSASILTYNPGAPFFDHPEQFGLTFSPASLAGALEFRTPACATKTLSPWEIQHLHQEFSTRIEAAVEASLGELSPDLVRRQLHFNEIGFSTIWNQRLLAAQHIAKHYQYVNYEGSHLDITAIPPAALADAIPQRTRLEVQLAPDGNVVLGSLTAEVKHLNDTASFLDEIACGQLTIREIARELYARLPGARPPFATVLDDTLAFYTRMAQEMYIAFVIP